MPRITTRVTRRRVRTAAIAAVSTAAILGSLTACSGVKPGSGSTAAGSSGTASATLWALTGDQEGVVQPSITSWNKSHPDAQIDAQYFANDAYKTKIKTAVGAGSAPTILYSWAGGTLKSYVDAGKVADLTSDVSGVKSKYSKSVWDLGEIDGKTYAVPMDPSYPVLMYWNKNVLQKAGISQPTTYDELLAAIPKLKAAGVIPFSLAGGSKWPLLMWEEYLVNRVAGASAFEKIAANESGAWSDPNIVKANTMIQTLVDKGAFGSSFNSVVADSNADVALLYTGKAAGLLQGAWIYGTLTQSAADFTKSGLAYGNFPTVSGGQGDPNAIVGNVSGYYSVSSNASAAQKKTAIEYLTKGVFDDEYTKTLIKNGQVPPLSDATSLISGGTSSFNGSVADLIAKAPSFQMSWDQALSPTASTALLNNLDKLFSKQITPQQFSEAMNQTIGK